MSTPSLIVVGGSRGIGRAIAERGASRGMPVATLSRSAGEAHAGIAQFVCDVCVTEQVVGTLQAAIAAVGPPRYVVYAAGTLGPVMRVDRAATDQFEQAFQVNVLGAHRVANALLPALRSVPGSALVFLSASSASHVWQGWGAYGASKAALDQLMRTIAAEEPDGGPTILSFVPGLTDTGMQEGLRAATPEDFPDVEKFKRWHERGASKRPAKVAEALEIVLARPRSELHGQVVAADEVLKRL